MSDPTRPPEVEPTKAALHPETEEINRLEMLLAQHGQTAQALSEVEESPQERLFSRKTLFGWAFGTLLVVFLIRMVIPIAFESAKDAVVSTLKEASENTAVTPVVAPAPPTTVILSAPLPATPERPEKPERPEQKERPEQVERKEPPEAGSGKATAAPTATPRTTVTKVEIIRR